MRGFGKDTENDRFRRPKALALKRTIPVLAVVLAAGAAIALALVLSIVATQAVDTGFKSPTAEGGNHNQWSSGSNAYASDNQYATAGSSDEDDDQSYENFNLGIPGGSVINGIEIRIEARSSDSNGCQAEVRMWNDSSNGHSSRRAQGVDGSDDTYILGSPSDLWGESWTSLDFSNGNFHAEIQYDDSGNRTCNGTFYLDLFQVKVYYSTPTPSPSPTPAPSVPAPQVESPGLPPECIAYDINLVLDSSGSIGAGLATMQSNIVSMITQVENQLPDTNWRGVTFRDPSGSGGSAGPGPAITVNSGGDANHWLTDPSNLITLINNMNSNGYTPTAHGIDGAINGGTFGAQPNLMLLITDGDPNVEFPGGNAPPADYWAGAMSAVPKADEARAAGWNTVAIQFGPGDSSAPGGSFSSDVLQGLAGPDIPGSVVGDVILVANVSDLGQALVDAVLENCTGSITIEKQTSPADNSTDFDFTSNLASPNDAFSLKDDETITFSGLNPGQDYTFTELGEAGWDLTNIDCGQASDADIDVQNKTVKVRLDNNEDVHCTYHNGGLGSIEVCKDVVPSDGGFTEWDFDLGGDATASIFDVQDGGCDTFGGLEAGDYVVSEVSRDGYDASIQCDNQTGNNTDTIAVALSAGEHVSCTFTNTSNASIEVCKDVVPDDSGATSWDFNLSGPTAGGWDGLHDGECHTFSQRSPGSYTLSENTQSGYQTTVDCGPNGSDGDADKSFTLSNGEHASCTFTNSKLPTVQVCKELVPENDGSEWDFTMSPGAVTVGSDLGDGDCSGVYTIQSGVPGSFSISEENKAGYTTTYDCGSFGSGVGKTADFDLVFGDAVVCTFTNTAVSQITVCKETSPDGSPGTWNVEISGPKTDDVDLSDDDCHTFGTLSSGVYSVTETDADDGLWDTEVDCGDGVVDGASVEVNLNAGDQITCTFTNYVRPTIEVCKEVVPADASTWSFTTDEPNAGSASGIGDGECDDIAFDAPSVGDVSTTLSEVTQTGYEVVSIDCGQEGSNSHQSSITLQAEWGDEISCTFTNEHLGSITVCKNVVPDDSGASQWDFDVDGPSAYHADVDDLSDDGCETLSNLTAGLYTIDEVTQSGYETAYNCDSDKGQGDGDNVTFDLANTEDVACTFVNTAQGTITVCKVVENVVSDASEWDFALAEVSGAVIDTKADLQDGDCEAFATVTAGTYSIEETDGPFGDGYYTTWSCGDAGSGVGTQTGQFALGAGGAVTCTFTNHKLATVTIAKDTTPVGGTNFGFTDDIAAPFGFSLDDGQSEVFGDLHADAYTVTENVPDGWSLDDVVCETNDTGDTTSDVTDGVAIDVDWGEDITCTYYNVEDSTIQVCKNIEPLDDGSTWDFSVAGVSIDDLGDDQCSDPILLEAGDHLVAEDSDLRYDTSVDCGDGIVDSDEVTVHLNAGDDVVCTFTNSYSTIEICKTVVPAEEGTWAFDVNAVGVEVEAGGCETVGPLPADSYDIVEISTPDYETSVDCGEHGSADGTSISVGLGVADSASCTFLNESYSTITVCKHLRPNDGSLWDFELSGDASATIEELGDNQCETFEDLVPGSYTVGEAEDVGYQASVECDTDKGSADGAEISFELGLSEDVTCTFTNLKLGSLTVIKHTAPAGDTTTEFPFESDLGPFTLIGDGDSIFFDNLPIDSYDIEELVPAGWALTGVSCTGVDWARHDNRIDIDVDPGEDAVCIFVNSQPGTITIVKQTEPSDDTSTGFDFSGDLGAFTLTGNGDSITFDGLGEGTYSFTEVITSGWTLEGIDCSDADVGAIDNGVEIHLPQSGAATCVFTNVQDGSITIEKLTYPTGDPQVFDFSGDLGAFGLSDSQATTFGSLPAGDYAVLEMLLVGWDLNSVQCGAADVDPASTGDSEGVVIHLRPGEDAKCSFNNVKETTPTPTPTPSPTPAPTPTPTPSPTPPESPTPTPPVTPTPTPTPTPSPTPPEETPTPEPTIVPTALPETQTPAPSPADFPPTGGAMGSDGGVALGWLLVLGGVTFVLGVTTLTMVARPRRFDQ